MKSRQTGNMISEDIAQPNTASSDWNSFSVKINVPENWAEEKEKEEKENKNKEVFNRALKLFFCFAGLQISYIAWGITQEQLMTNEYKLGKFTSSSFCVFGNRFFALLVSLAIVSYRKISMKTPLKEAPYQYYAPSSISNSISSWAQYEALKFVSFPTQVLSKSCKVIPVMLVGIVLNRKSYPLMEYLEAIAITFGVALFTFSEKHRASDTSRVDTYYGATLLILYLCCDSFTSQWQSKVFKQFSVDQFQMMLGVNLWSIVMTGATLIYTGEGIKSIAFIMSDSQAFLHMMILSVTSATGQLFIFYTIKEFGPVIFTIMMTTRQVFSLFLSCLLFSHHLSTMGWIGSFTVFCIVFNRIYRKGSD